MSISLLCLILAGGYDSDVERERVIDYVSKTYVDPIRDASRPVLEEKPTSQRPKIKRKTTSTPRVVTKEDKTEIKVRKKWSFLCILHACTISLCLWVHFFYFQKEM